MCNFKIAHAKVLKIAHHFSLCMFIVLPENHSVFIANNPLWKAHVKEQSHAWKSHVMDWLNYREIPTLIVGYENLKKDTYTELKRMLDFIGYPYSEDDVLCTVKNSGEAFHRKHTKDLHPYSSELQKIVLNEIKEVDAVLLKHNISLYHPY